MTDEQLINGNEDIILETEQVNESTATEGEELTSEITEAEKLKAAEQLHYTNLQEAIKERDLTRRKILMQFCARRNEQEKQAHLNVKFNVAELLKQQTFSNCESTKRRALSIENVKSAGIKVPVPIRLDLDLEGFKLSDFLLFEYEPVTEEKPALSKELDVIAFTLCNDFDLPTDLFHPLVVKSIQEQLDEFDVYWNLRVASGEEARRVFDGLIVPLRLDIIIGEVRLEDRLEWDLTEGASENLTGNTDSSFDESSNDGDIASFLCKSLWSDWQKVMNFAKTYKIASDFLPAIHHNLLEQILLYRKAILFGSYHRDNRTGLLKFHDADVAAVLISQPQPASNLSGGSIRRMPTSFDAFTPAVATLTGEDLEKLESSRERENRRKRRQTGKPPAVTNSANLASSAAVTAPLWSSMRSPPRTLPTPTSYRGSLHRIVMSKLDDEGNEAIIIGAAKTQATVGRKRKRRTTKQQ